MKQKIADLINVFFGMRKLIAWFSLFFVGIALRLKGFIDGGQFVDLMKSTFLGFVAGNSTEHLLTTVKEYISSKGKIDSTVTDVPKGDDLVDGDEAEEAKAEEK